MAGYPVPQIKWLKDEQDWTPDGERIKAFTNDDGTFGLVFETTTGDDKATYTAIAYSDEGFARYRELYYFFNCNLFLILCALCPKIPNSGVFAKNYLPAKTVNFEPLKQITETRKNMNLPYSIRMY